MKRLLILLVLVSSAVQAEIYKSQNEKGEWIYSDRPSPRAETMKLPPLSTYTPPPQRTTQQNDSTGQKKASGLYKSIVFAEPKNDSAIQGNEGVVNVILKLDPLLNSQRGHKIQYYLDQAPYGSPLVSSRVAISNLERGTHVLGASVLDAEGKKLISASPVTFHTRRDSALNPNNLNNPINPKSLKNPQNIADNPNNPYNIKNNPNAPGPIFPGQSKPKPK